MKAIAEEINNDLRTVASTLASVLQLEYLYADPDRKERIERDIPVDIVFGIQQEYIDQYPEISIWPSEPCEDNLPTEVWEEYSKRANAANRLREKVWLEKIANITNWPLLFICGADHFDEFATLLKNSGYRAINSDEDCEP